MEKKRFLYLLWFSLVFSSFQGVKSAFDLPKVFYLISLSGAFGSFYLFKVDKLAGLFGFLTTFNFLATSLSFSAPGFLSSYGFLTIVATLSFYYAARRMGVCLKDIGQTIVPFILANILLSLWQIFIKRSYLGIDITQTVGFMGSTSRLASLFSVTAPIMLESIGVAALVPIFFLLFKCKSLFSIIAVLSGLSTYVFFKAKRKSICLLVCLLSILCLIIYAQAVELDGFVLSLDQRIGVWLEAMNRMFANPSRLLTGWGLGSFHAIFTNIDTANFSPTGLGTRINYEGAFVNHPHNEFLLGFFEMGYLSVILSFLVCARVLVNTVTNLKDSEIQTLASCLVAFFIFMNGYFLTMSMWAVLAVVLAAFENRVVKLEVKNADEV